MFGYDGLNRRSFEYDSIDPVRSRRDYSYPPNGQLGTISGKTASNASWTVTMRYDEHGRPLTIVYSGGDSMELFWDESDRLIDTVITHASPVSGVTIVRWHYHYVGGTLIAAFCGLACTNRTSSIKKTEQCRVEYQRDWDTHEKLTTEHGLFQTYHTLSHDLYYQRSGERSFELWLNYQTYCEPCVAQLPAEIPNTELFPAGMALPPKVIDCFYFIDANNREWHSPIEAKLPVDIVRDPLLQGPPADQVLEWPPRKFKH